MGEDWVKRWSPELSKAVLERDCNMETEWSGLFAVECKWRKEQ